MSSGKKCKNCGSSDIEVDPARGDAVCTNCGSVLEDSIIVSEVQFEEGAHGSSSAIGQFVAADSKGGSTKFGASFHVVGGLESREITLRKARNGISVLGNQLKLNQHCIDTACSFFKMALSSNLTRGRKNSHIHAACVYLSCRTEGTAHLLIDISDVLQICCYELGRTYLRLSQALCINVPSVDPCLYILRFASKLEFGSKTQQVTNTALRLVQRMKRDSIHSGRRPSGLCGAALLIASRLHEFNRSVGDIVKVVKVHESTMRKRLIEFGDTPSSALTLEEFMTVDLEEEQDPPSFKAARKKDKERLQRLMEEEADTISELQKQIEKHLVQAGDKNDKKRASSSSSKNLQKIESTEAKMFIKESTLGTIHKIIEESVEGPSILHPAGLGPDIASIGLPSSLDDTANALVPNNSGVSFDANFDDVDDEELDSYIMTESEFETKRDLWHELNADYLKKQKEREEKLRQEREEGKPEKKRKRPARKKTMGPVNSAGEAIEKIIQEKKISSKINYEVLKSLNAAPVQNENVNVEDGAAPTTSEAIKMRRLSSTSDLPPEQTPKKQGRNKKVEPTVGLPLAEDVKDEIKKVREVNVKKQDDRASEEEEIDEDYEEEQPQEEPGNELGVFELLKQHREDEDGGDEYGYGEYGYEEDY